MWMKLSLLLTFVCTVSDSVQKRSSVLTDESKRILDIFDFSNFDKQEALSYIDRQRYENLIRGKRSKWNISQNLLNSEMSSGDKDNHKLQKKMHDSIDKTIDNYDTKESLLNDDGLNSIRHHELDFEYFRKSPMQHEFRRGRSPESFENLKDLERNSSGLLKNANDKMIEVADSQDENDIENDIAGETDRHEKGKSKRKKKKKRHHWSKWTEWSPCSVTCGKGRRIRSRKCIAKSCVSGELEMGEKSCQLPACSWFDKFFSFLT